MAEEKEIQTLNPHLVFVQIMSLMTNMPSSPGPLLIMWSLTQGDAAQIEKPFNHIEFEKVHWKKSDDKAGEHDLLGAVQVTSLWFVLVHSKTQPVR